MYLQRFLNDMCKNNFMLVPNLATYGAVSEQKAFVYFLTTRPQIQRVRAIEGAGLSGNVDVQYIAKENKLKEVKGYNGAGGGDEDDDKAIKGIIYLSVIKINAQRTSQKTRLQKYLLLVGSSKLSALLELLCQATCIVY